MARVQTYSGAFLRGLPPAYLASGLGQDSTDVLSPDYNPLTPVEPTVPVGVPYANAPAYTPPIQTNAPSGIYDPITGTYTASLPASDNPTAGTGPIASTPSSGIISAGTIIPGGTSIPIGVRPSPTVAVPLSTSSIGLWFGSATTIPGVPNYLLALGFVVAVGALFAGGSSSRRRR